MSRVSRTLFRLPWNKNWIRREMENGSIFFDDSESLHFKSSRSRWGYSYCVAQPAAILGIRKMKTREKTASNSSPVSRRHVMSKYRNREYAAIAMQSKNNPVFVDVIAPILKCFFFRLRLFIEAHRTGQVRATKVTSCVCLWTKVNSLANCASQFSKSISWHRRLVSATKNH